MTKEMILLKLDNMLSHYRAAARKTGDINITYVLEEIRELVEKL